MSARCLCELCVIIVCEMNAGLRGGFACCLFFCFFFWVSQRPRIRFALRVSELFASSDLPDREDTLSPFLGPRDERARLSCS